jgi:hypothetical protein
MSLAFSGPRTLACRDEGFFDAEVNFQEAASEPAAARGECRRFLEFVHAQNLTPELPACRPAGGRAVKLSKMRVAGGGQRPGSGGTNAHRQMHVGLA